MKTMSKSASSLLLLAALATTVHAGSLWPAPGQGAAGMYADRKAAIAGDILTVVVAESAVASNSQSKKSERDSSLDDAFTLAHELGHSLHTWHANRAQPHRTARYPIFLAEIASTVNELLLTHHLLASPPADDFRIHLLNHLCDSFKSTVFRQTMFAEFERNLHRWEEEGTPLTADFLHHEYYELNKKYLY